MKLDIQEITKHTVKRLVWISTMESIINEWNHIRWVMWCEWRYDVVTATTTTLSSCKGGVCLKHTHWKRKLIVCMLVNFQSHLRNEFTQFSKTLSCCCCITVNMKDYTMVIRKDMTTKNSLVEFNFCWINDCLRKFYDEQTIIRLRFCLSWRNTNHQYLR